MNKPDSLFSRTKQPLAYRAAPLEFDEFVGQKHIMAKDSPLRKLIEKDAVQSCIFWGPPGCGKTALARLISLKTKANFIHLNAAIISISDLKTAIVQGRESMATGKRTIVFIDEIHRLSKIHQDAILSDIEEGNIIVIGASTENPYYSLSPAMRSRLKVYRFNPLSVEELTQIAKKVINDRRGLGGKISITQEAITIMAQASSGDARRLINYIEEAYLLSEGKEIDKELALKVTDKPDILYDKKEMHYNITSAFIKSVRGSDPDAALYYLAKMLAGGEDPMFIARRLAILASEDIGNADPQAMLIADATLNIVSKIGMPEASLALAQATIYMSMCPKSNAVYRAIKKAQADVEAGIDIKIPRHLKKPFKDYKYPHDFPKHWVDQKYMEPHKKYYESNFIGFEKKLEEWLKWMKKTNLEK